MLDARNRRRIAFWNAFRLTAILAATAVVATQAPPQRIVSLVPALTDMLLAIGARPQLAAVSSYDDAPEVKDLPRVGGLLDSDVGRIISRRPDLVLVYGTQQDLVTQLARASIPVFNYRHAGLTHVIATMRELGKTTGHTSEAERVVGDIERRITLVKTRTAAANKVPTLLVFGRERGTLRGIYASGGRGFLHDMLEAAGGINVFADMASESVQVSAEMILTRRPAAIVELRSVDIPSLAARKTEIDSWSALSTVPAVRNLRVYLLGGKSLVVPGPLVADGVEQIARVLHPELFK